MAYYGNLSAGWYTTDNTTGWYTTADTTTSNYIVWDTSDWTFTPGNWTVAAYEPPPPRAPLTPQQRGAATRRRNTEARERQAAQVRAEALLRSELTPEQIEQLESGGAFVIAGASGRRFQIRRGRSGNVRRLDDAGRAVEQYCIHPIEDVPDADTMLAQLLWLQANEQQFERVANRTRLA